MKGSPVRVRASAWQKPLSTAPTTCVTRSERTIGKAVIRRLQEWIGHVDVETTMKYLRYVPREKLQHPREKLQHPGTVRVCDLAMRVAGRGG
jgi:hypothetical protein